MFQECLPRELALRWSTVQNWRYIWPVALEFGTDIGTDVLCYMYLDHSHSPSLTTAGSPGDLQQPLGSFSSFTCSFTQLLTSGLHTVCAQDSPLTRIQSGQFAHSVLFREAITTGDKKRGWHPVWGHTTAISEFRRLRQGDGEFEALLYSETLSKRRGEGNREVRCWRMLSARNASFGCHKNSTNRIN